MTFSTPPQPPPPTPISNLLSESWSQASKGYNEIFTTQFEPWTRDALSHLEQALHHPHSFLSPPLKRREDEDVKRINVYIPCCGPGQEIIPVYDTILQHVGGDNENEGIEMNVLGLDLSPGMVEIARHRIKTEMQQSNNNNNKSSLSDGTISAMVGDAALPPPPPPPSKSSSSSSSYHVLFSCFGLQQIPNPTSVLQTWIASLSVGGIGVVLYWPPTVEEDEEDGPWSLWSTLVQKKLLEEHKQNVTKERNNSMVEKDKQRKGSNSAPPPPPTTSSDKNNTQDWDQDLINHLSTLPTIQLLSTTPLKHQIKWTSIPNFWTSMTQYGPWKAMRLKRGDDFVDGLYKDFQTKMSGGRGMDDDDGGKVVHFPKARLLVFVKIHSEKVEERKKGRL